MKLSVNFRGFRIDDDIKRPSSPIERIKSFFRKSRDPATTNVNGASNVNNHMNGNAVAANSPTVTSASAYPVGRDYARYSPVESQASSTNKYLLCYFFLI